MKLLSYTDFIPLFNTEISFIDNRSQSMPNRKTTGLLVGIRLDSIEVREGNVLTRWFPINSLNIKYNI